MSARRSAAATAEVEATGPDMAVAAGTARVPLAAAAQRLGVSWQVAWRLVLCGELAGAKDRGRWTVDAASLERLAARRSRDGHDDSAEDGATLPADAPVGVDVPGGGPLRGDAHD